MRINEKVVAVAILMLSALLWSGCSQKSQSPEKAAADKAQSQYTSKAVKSVQEQYSISRDARKLTLKASDEEIIRAIDDSGVMKRDDGSLEVIPPVKIVEKGKRNRNGSWPVRVKFTIKYKMKEGKISQPTETTSLFSITEEKDSSGKTVWKAKLGS